MCSDPVLDFGAFLLLRNPPSRVLLPGRPDPKKLTASASSVRFRLFGFLASCSSPVSYVLENFARQASVYGVAAGYCISAGLLSIINKWAIMVFPYPGALTALQYLTSVAGIVLCGRLGLLEHDPLDPRTMWRFLPAAAIFYLSIFTNSELLLYANVDTFIVFRSSVPILEAAGETLCLGQPWPSPRTWLALLTIFAGGLVYVATDYEFTPVAYGWAVAYLVSMAIDFVYIKHVVMTIGLNTWGLILYNNLEAVLLFPLELLIMDEMKEMKQGTNAAGGSHLGATLPVGLSCLFGLSISFFEFSCRRAISSFPARPSVVTNGDGGGWPGAGEADLELGLGLGASKTVSGVGKVPGGGAAPWRECCRILTARDFPSMVASRGSPISSPSSSGSSCLSPESGDRGGERGKGGVGVAGSKRAADPLSPPEMRY